MLPHIILSLSIRINHKLNFLAHLLQLLSGLHRKTLLQVWPDVVPHIKLGAAPGTHCVFTNGGIRCRRQHCVDDVTAMCADRCRHSGMRPEGFLSIIYSLSWQFI